MAKQSDIAKELKKLKSENRILLAELEEAYKSMEAILVQTEKEKEITYRELENKYTALQHTYSELSRKENMLIHMEKLSSIGQFITEIVHELKTPLTVISSATEIVLLNELPEESRDILSKIPEQVKRMSGMLGRFKAMAYKEKEKFTCFDINLNLNDFIETLELITPKSIEISCDLSEDELKVKGDAYQLTQIYLNLAKNAFDAMDDVSDACLSIKTRLVNAIEITDNGPGIPDDNLEFLFDTFFTTKERGKGTGLGLSIAKDIAKKFYGNIAVKSKKSKGTTFQIFIPIAGKEECLNKIMSEHKDLRI
ncbi:MAG: HAMP domain-containing sensor histidine kinase [Calditrichaceae bacterium]